MTEKQTSRIVLISFMFYIILYSFQITLQIWEVDLAINIILFILNNICIIVFCSICFWNEKKKSDVIRVLIVTIISDIMLIGTCCISYGISRLL